jgi:glycosyltransferase involved in cell wall biosynthesis
MDPYFLTVVMPNYNHAKYLHESLDAILNQEYKNFELIIIDDGSTDNSFEIIKEYQNKNSNIRFFQNKKNLGVIQTVNMGISLANGEYLAFCAADDIVFSEFFKDTVNFVKKNSNIAICCGESSYFDGKNPYQFHNRRFYLGEETIIIKKGEILKYLRNSSFKIQTHVSIFRKDAVLKFGGYKENLKCLSDWYLNYQIGFNFNIAHIPKPFGAVRIVNNSYAHQFMPNKSKREEIYKNLINEIEKEDENTKKVFMKSAIIQDLGLRMVEYIFKRPKYWNYLYYVLKFIPNMIKNKIFN